MGWYVLRRIAVMIPVFLGATLLIYGAVFLLPGDPVAAIAGELVDKSISRRQHFPDWSRRRPMGG